MTRGSVVLLTSVAAACFVTVISSEVSAQRLPSPDSSRAPLLTRLPADSIRLQVRQMRLMEFLAALQRADSTAVDAALSGATWAASDNVSRRLAPCRSLGTAVSSFSSRLSARHGGDHLPIFFDRVATADSGGTTVASGTVLLVSPSGLAHRTGFALAYHSSEPRWTSARGLLAAICKAATGDFR